MLINLNGIRDMRFRIILISMFFSSVCLAHESIGKNDLVGNWDSIDRSEEWIPSMVITDEGEIAFSRTAIHSSGHELRTECKSDMSKVQSIEGVFIIPCTHTKTTSFKLVFLGWASAPWAEDKVIKIVGMLYMLSHGAPDKGVPFTMERRGVTDTKTLNMGSGDPDSG